jgi:sulfite reductase (NADPH) flavoprotein alpha-component
MNDEQRLIAAAGATAVWLMLVAWTIWRHRPRREQAAAGAVLVAYASQTGTAANLARATADRLIASGRDVSVRSFAGLTPAMLAATKEALFILATTGEGDPPDDAAVLLKRLASQSLDLGGLRYAALALGDSHYRNFCAFGRAFDKLLGDFGAERAVDRIEVDQSDAGALRQWQQNLRLFGASTALPDWEAPRYAPWTLIERELLNSGSPGAPMSRLSLRPKEGAPEWKAGDVAEVYPDTAENAFADSHHLPHRDYSVATIPGDGALDIVVRVFRDADGRVGLGSGWLCADRPTTGSMRQLATPSRCARALTRASTRPMRRSLSF